MAHARRAHAGLGEPVIEPRGSAVAEVGADRLMNRAEHLQQHEDRAGKRERTRERIAALHRADEHTHGDRERCRQDPSQQQGRPPSGGEARVCLRQDGEELPFLALDQSSKHDRILPQNRRAHRYLEIVSQGSVQTPVTTGWHELSLAVFLLL